MATVAAARSPAAGREPFAVFRALARRAAREARTRTLGFTYLFLAVSYIQPVAYRHTYPTLADRVGFAHSFAGNKAVVLFYGRAFDLLTVGGYSAWRVGGILTIFAAVFGMLAAVRALRAEEDAGRAELVLAAPVSRDVALAASLTGTAATAFVLWAACFAGLVAGGLPVGGSAYLALAVSSTIPVFLGVGALASQLAPTRRMAIELGGGFVALCFLLRVVADTAKGASWLRWLTPLGWVEQLRPFTGARPPVLVLPLAGSALLMLVVARISGARDLGTGILAARERARSRFALLSSAPAHALRDEAFGLGVWTVGLGALALVMGILSGSVSSLGISTQLEHALEKLGVGPSLTPKAYLGFTFSFFVLLISLFAVSQVAAARREEADGRLETLLALPLGRRHWLGGRLGLAAGAATGLSLWAGLLAWAGALSAGVTISLPQMLEASVNCLPMMLLSLGVAGLAYALFPRGGGAVAYGLLIVAYLWQLFGSVLGAPRWLLDATPFAHLGAVPAVAFQAEAAAIMAAAGAFAALLALAWFGRRDLVGA